MHTARPSESVSRFPAKHICSRSSVKCIMQKARKGLQQVKRGAEGLLPIRQKVVTPFPAKPNRTEPPAKGTRTPNFGQARNERQTRVTLIWHAASHECPLE
jgi:hypothetical protein